MQKRGTVCLYLQVEALRMPDKTDTPKQPTLSRENCHAYSLYHSSHNRSLDVAFENFSGFHLQHEAQRSLISNMSGNSIHYCRCKNTKNIYINRGFQMWKTI